MQVFLTNEDLRISAMDLDDVRLSKQITEINQILLSYLNYDSSSVVGHKNHPVNLHYQSFDGINFLLDYLQELTAEYHRRFDKLHMGSLTYYGMQKSFESLEGCGLLPKILIWDIGFKPAYVKGRKGIDQVIDTENVYTLYRELLTDKWNNDKVEPKWTNRSSPTWFRKEGK